MVYGARINSFMVQEIHGDRDVTAVNSLKIKAFVCIQAARDANANSNVKPGGAQGARPPPPPNQNTTNDKKL